MAVIRPMRAACRLPDISSLTGLVLPYKLSKLANACPDVLQAHQDLVPNIICQMAGSCFPSFVCHLIYHDTHMATRLVSAALRAAWLGHTVSRLQTIVECASVLISVENHQAEHLPDKVRLNGVVEDHGTAAIRGQHPPSLAVTRGLCLHLIHLKLLLRLPLERLSRSSRCLWATQLSMRGLRSTVACSALIYGQRTWG